MGSSYKYAIFDVPLLSHLINRSGFEIYMFQYVIILNII